MACAGMFLDNSGVGDTISRCPAGGRISMFEIYNGKKFHGPGSNANSSGKQCELLPGHAHAAVFVELVEEID